LRLRLDLVLGDRLAAVEAGADAVGDGREIGVLAVRAAPGDDAVGLEPGLAIAGAPVGQGPHRPGLGIVLCQPAGVQQRCFTAATRTDHLTAEELSDVIGLGNIEGQQQFRALPKSSPQMLPLGFGQFREGHEGRNCLFDGADEPIEVDPDRETAGAAC
jgi:hypothetical protein